MTKEKINIFKEKLYYQYNLINSFIFDYIEDITYNIINYINLINLKTNTIISPKLNETIVSIYDELSAIINNKFDVLNYENLERRRLESIFDKDKDTGKLNISGKILDNLQEWNLILFPISINLFDFLKQCGIDIAEKSKAFNIGGGFKLNLKIEMTLIIGFEFWLNFYFSGKYTEIYIELYIEAGISLSAEFGYFKDFTKLELLKTINDLLKLGKDLTDVKENLNLCSRFKTKKNNTNNIDDNQKNLTNIKFLSISIAVGVDINLASIRGGIKYEYSTKENSNKIFLYYEFKTCCIKLYFYFEFKFLDLISIKLEFGFDLLCLYKHNDSYPKDKDIPTLNAQ